jgi:serine/threonine protein kinase
MASSSDYTSSSSRSSGSSNDDDDSYETASGWSTADDKGDDDDNDDNDEDALLLFPTSTRRMTMIVPWASNLLRRRGTAAVAGGGAPVVGAVTLSSSLIDKKNDNDDDDDDDQQLEEDETNHRPRPRDSNNNIIITNSNSNEELTMRRITTTTNNINKKKKKRRKYSGRYCYGDMASTWAVMASCSMFLYVTIFLAPTAHYISDPYQTVRQRTKERLRHHHHAHDQKKSSYSSFFFDFNIFHQEQQHHQINNVQQQQLPDTTETLPEGCVPMTWQAGNFPNCNTLHEISLPAIQRSTTFERGRYVASGLWRDVWQVVGSSSSSSGSGGNDTDSTAVLKILKMEHDVNARNFDRHRRDALVMEQLTANPYVVNIYGYCGNTILTEALSMTLQDAIVSGSIIEKSSSSNNNNNSRIHPRKNAGPLQTNITKTDRLHWALDVARGVQALHEHGIVHADLQLEQFLFETENENNNDHDPNGKPQPRRRRRIKINDFNRCRFLAVHNNTNTTTMTNGDNDDHYSLLSSSRCTFRIPSAPGKQRSPEEYIFDDLTEKMDIYATANILYAIFTRQRPWSNFGSAETKRRIGQGYLPPMEYHSYIDPNLDHGGDDGNDAGGGGGGNNVVDPAWIALTHRAYALDPLQRPNATELVTALEQLLKSSPSSSL